MMNHAEDILSIKGLPTKSLTQDTIVLHSLNMPKLMSKAMIIAKEWELVQSDEMPLQPQVLIEPFERWDLGFVGPITSMSNKK